MTNDKRRDDALDAYLQGDLAFEDLPPELRHDESRLRVLMGQLGQDVRAPAGLKADVMREIEALPSSRWRELISWFVRPRTFQLRPATVGALAAAALAAVTLLPRGDSSAGMSGAEGGAGVADAGVADAGVAGPSFASTNVNGAMVPTRFVFVAKDAESVALTGSWLGWDADQIVMQELRGSGVWTVDVPVPPGVHEYSFVVDGSEWRPDPLASAQADDGFGRVNSVLMVAGAEV